jgi:hypothetical protein
MPGTPAASTVAGTAPAGAASAGVAAVRRLVCVSLNAAIDKIGAVDRPVSGETAITGIDRGCRLIKGQVFLWNAGQSAQDLWDIDGTITPP